jgi:hypothetical protein
MTARKTKNPAAKKAAVKTANGSTSVNKPGVISTIVDCISKERGSTVDETLAVLTKKFDRDPAGMRKTALIQSNKQKTSKEVVDGRGTVFYKRR